MYEGTFKSNIRDDKYSIGKIHISINKNYIELIYPLENKKLYALHYNKGSLYKKINIFVTHESSDYIYGEYILLDFIKDIGTFKVYKN